MFWNARSSIRNRRELAVAHLGEAIAHEELAIARQRRAIDAALRAPSTLTVCQP
jgi:hypothetical protein